MKKIVILALTCSLFGLSSAMAESIVASKVSDDLSKININSKVWQGAKEQSFIAYPQTTIEMIDADVIKLNAHNKAKKILVKALSDGQNIAFLLKWKDSSNNVQEGYSATAYGDGFAVQLPIKLDSLPYIGMGSEGRPVIVHLQKATGKTYEPNGNKDVYHQVNASNQNAFEKDLQTYKGDVTALGNGDYQRAFISEGFRSMTQIKDNSEDAMMQMSYSKGMWSGVIVRKLKSANLDLSKGTFPVAFAFWDGDKKNRDGAKVLSSWLGVSVQGSNVKLSYLDEMNGGDAKNGEQVMLDNCSSCHQYKEIKNAPNFMAPNLSNIGGYSNASYLVESITHPNAVVVPGYNVNAHPSYPWYSVDDKGVRTSMMPPFDSLDKKSLTDLVAYLKTLKAEVE
ncbi:MAG: ethylbenzene dehydrogenase-related protein [Sulfurospirillaceae bacterium]|nr:ethylbenzene dehydrogenase-related protein [Sulfurospirillaceae bacterium]MDD2827897.1 ethylbenzene dehydrogenase-related protein [Sulfurospirillaceae bacterium]